MTSETDGHAAGGARYDPDYVRAYYDAFGAREWERFERTPANRVNLHLHLWHLRRHIRAGQHVLDVGAGPGRFTIELARLGARVTVGDLSPVQLELNRQKVQEAGAEGSVVARALLDVTDLGALPSESFDATVCYGGALSYVFDRADRAVGELLRVTRPGGLVLLSVMSLLGTCRRFLADCLATARQHGPETVRELLATGDQIGALAGGHTCHLYRWAELEALLRRHPCEVVDVAAANFLAIGGNEALLPPVLEDAALWEAYLAWEVECCRQPGAVDGGTHIIAVVRRTRG
ncbi:MAG TPA: class I SAM-dependent methyltransferase [Candidatus Limnocylindria bacterium]|nr:class I SAM-dependent methyltransferase [Candidatus Limnocylindria bacterium]